MKSAHKLGAALATFILLSVVAYFTITSLHQAALNPQEQETSRAGNKNTTATGQQREQAAASSVATFGADTLAGSGASGHHSPETSSAAESTTTTPTPVTTQATSSVASGTTTTASLSISSSGATETSASDGMASSTVDQAQTTTTTTPQTTTTEAAGSSEPTSTSEIPAEEQNISTISALYDEKTRRPLANFAPSPSELEQWAQFRSRYMKAYPSQQAEAERMAVFIGNLRFISAFNNLADISFKLGVNRFADLTQNETNALFIGPPHSPEPASAGDHRLRIIPDSDQIANRSVDWHHLLAEGGPAEQGSCLDSAIFALAASLESTLNAASNNKTKLSEQQLIDCVSHHLVAARGAPPVCSGRLTPADVLSALESPHIKLSTIHDYHQFKLAAAAGQAPSDQCVPPAQADTRPYVQSHVTVPHENIDEALQNSGPLIVALDASQPTFHFYKTGVYHDLQCSPDSSNFYALLVAHSAGPAQNDQQQSEPAYRIRASLGPDWGEAGHMRLSSDPQRNKCGPQGVAFYPNIGFE